MRPVDGDARSVFDLRDLLSPGNFQTGPATEVVPSGRSMHEDEAATSLDLSSIGSVLSHVCWWPI